MESAITEGLPVGCPVATASPRPTSRSWCRRKVADADNAPEVLSKAAGPLRVREVVEGLGLDAREGNLNVIRTRLERLAKDGRAQGTGRGLYTVADGPPAAESRPFRRPAPAGERVPGPVVRPVCGC